MQTGPKLPIVVSALLIASSACSRPDTGTGPAEWRPQTRFALEAASKGPRVKVAVHQLVRSIGCTAVGTTDGETKVATLQRSLVEDIVGSLDSIDAPIISGKPTLGSLHVVSGPIRISGRSETFSVHCLAPISATQQRIGFIISTDRRLPGLVAANLRSYENNENKTAETLASDLLLSVIRSGEPKKMVSASKNQIALNKGINGPRFDLACGPGSGTDYACGTPTLPTVTVTATPGYPVIVDVSMLYHDYRVYSLSDLFGIWFYGGPDCGNASETWIALNDQINELEQQYNDLAAATSEVAALTCESSLTSEGRDLCLDLFIMTERAGFILEGDDRRFDPYAPAKASRAQIYINPHECMITPVVNTTRTVTFGPFGGGEHAPHKLNRVAAYRDAAGACVVEWDLLNGWCQTHDVLTLGGVLCPTIEGKMTLVSDGNGGFTANVNEDKYPSRGLYKWNGSSWQTLSERRETIWLDLGTWRRHIESLKIARDESMPAGCNLQ